MPDNLDFSIDFYKTGNRQLTFDDKSEAAKEATFIVESLVYFVTSPERYSLENIDIESLQTYLDSARSVINKFLSVARKNFDEINEQRIELDKKNKG